MFTEPLMWLFFYFFQPTKLAREIETPFLLRSAMRLLRLLLPLLLISYAVALFSELVSYSILHLISLNAPLSQNLLSYQLVLLFFVTVWTLFSILLGILFGITTGIALCLAFAGAIGIIFGGIGFTVYDLPYFLMYGCALGVALGVPFGMKEPLPTKDIISATATGLAKGLVAILVLGMALTPDLFFQPRLDSEFGFTLGDSGYNLIGGIIVGVVILCLALAFAGDISLGFVETFEATLKRRIIRGLMRGLRVAISSCITLLIIFGIYSIVYTVSRTSGSSNIPFILLAFLIGLIFTAIPATLVVVFTTNWQLPRSLAALLGAVLGVSIFAIYKVQTSNDIIGPMSSMIVAILGCLVGVGVSLIVYNPASWKRTILAGGGASVLVLGLTLTDIDYIFNEALIVYSLIIAISVGVVISFAVANTHRRGSGRRVRVSFGLGFGLAVGAVVGVVAVLVSAPNAISIGLVSVLLYGILCSFIARNGANYVLCGSAGVVVGGAAGILAAFLYDAQIGILTGVMVGTWIAIIAALASCITTGRPRNLIFALVSGVVTGSIVGCIVGARSADLTLGLASGVGVGIASAIIVGIILGVAAIQKTGVTQGKIRGLVVGLLVGVISAFAFIVRSPTSNSYIIAIIIALAAGIAASNKRLIALILAIGMIGGMLLGFFAIEPLIHLVKIPYPQSYIFNSFVSSYLIIVLVFSLGAGLLASIIYSIGPTITAVIPRGVIFSLLAGLLVWAILSSYPVYLDLVTAFLGGLIVCITCMVMYLLIYYRLPLYAVSSLSLYRAYQASRRKQERAFEYLHHSALYWDEMCPFALPNLKQLLLLAAEQNREQTLKEIDFIVHERSKQKKAAQAASLEIAIHDLEVLTTIDKIAQASERLTTILSREVDMIDPLWNAPFARLSDASREAARYCSPVGWLARRKALVSMIESLKPVYGSTMRDALLNQRLEKIFTDWREIAQDELEELKQSPERASLVVNPYNPGPALEMEDTLFVGRSDLAQQLSDALGYGKRRPTFLLNGERRMGKSSTLMQLPALLGAQYLPIFFDLQNRGMSSSVVAFLGNIAASIFETLDRHGVNVKKLEYEQIRSASLENEATAYWIFDEWFKSVEQILEKQNRTLLLTLDEFEKLEEAGRDKNLKIDLLLDWFRNIIQNHPRLALLFSGVQHFSDMGDNWAGYFVNVQTLKVSFLHYTEAQQLITQPIPQFPAQEIFGEGVVEEIIRATNCHPFLIQAVCSALLDALNAEKRTRAELQDVENAANRVLKNWGETYFLDLWNRTSIEQRRCLVVLNELGDADFASIQQQTDLEERIVYLTLEKLLDRDLILKKQDKYSISVPLIARWIRMNYRR